MGKRYSLPAIRDLILQLRTVDSWPICRDEVRGLFDTTKKAN
jgi:hypothetical protein